MFNKDGQINYLRLLTISFGTAFLSMSFAEFFEKSALFNSSSLISLALLALLLFLQLVLLAYHAYQEITDVLDKMKLNLINNDFWKKLHVITDRSFQNNQYIFITKVKKVYSILRC